MRAKRLIFIVAGVAVLAIAGWGGHELMQQSTTAAVSNTANLPTTVAKRGDVSFSIIAKGELQGGNTEVLAAPMTGGSTGLIITQLRESGELVKAGDVVIQFDTTEQEYALREAEADLAESEQQVVQATAESEAKAEEARLALIQAKTDLKVAEIECRRNPLVPRMVARQNELGLAAAQDKVRQLEKDLNDRIAAAKAGIAIQEAARSKATVAAQTARRNIDAMTLKAKSEGYVARQQNSQGNFRWGSFLPNFQVGDTVQAGMGVAQIPDLHNWEAAARVGELDRGHIALNQDAELTVVALPGRKFKAKIKSIGGTTGPPWDRYFETKLSIIDPSPELRPGMSTRMTVNTGTLKQVIWLPAQALFESDGRKFVYVHSAAGFTPKDVKLIRRSESRVVVEGLQENQLVALANPDQMKKQKQKTGALQAITR